MESFTIELVSNASAHLLPDNTLSSFTNFFPEQLNLDGEWEVAITERSHPSAITAKTVSKLKCLEERKKNEIYFANEGSALAFFSTDLGHICGSNVGNDFGVMLRGKGPHKLEFAYDIA